MNKIGFNLLAWSAVVSDKLIPVAERLKKIGYDGVECLIGAEDGGAYRRFGSRVRDMGLEMTAVLVVGKDENPVSDSPEIRKNALHRIQYAIDRAHDLNAQIICGPFHSAHGIFSRQSPEDEEFSWSAEVLHAAGDHAAEAGITLALEAVNRFECYLCNTAEQLTRLVNEVNHPNVKAMYDTHHANIEEKNVPAAVKRIGGQLAHVHISENDRGTPGDGQVNWDDTFSTLSEMGYNGWLTIEAFTRNDPDFANAINVWREYSKPWDIAENGLQFIKTMVAKYE